MESLFMLENQEEGPMLMKGREVGIKFAAVFEKVIDIRGHSDWSYRLQHK